MIMNLSTLFTLAFAFLSIISAPSKASDEVVDWSGQPLKARVAYDVWGVGLWRGPISMGVPTPQTQLINYVINKPHQDPRLLPDPIIFYPANQSETMVRVGQDYSIAFDDDSKKPFNVWRVDDKMGSNDYNFITTGGQKDNPGCWNIHSWFQLAVADENEHLYKLISNPQVCIHSRNPAEVTSTWKDGENRLYLKKDYSDEKDVIHLRFVEHKPIIRQVVGENSWW